MPEKDDHWLEGLEGLGGEWAVGAYETCHPDPNWRSLIMRGCPLVNGPVFAVM